MVPVYSNRHQGGLVPVSLVSIVKRRVPTGGTTDAPIDQTPRIFRMPDA